MKLIDDLQSDRAAFFEYGVVLLEAGVRLLQGSISRQPVEGIA